MNTDRLKELIRKANDPNASEQERREAELLLKNIRVSFDNNDKETRLAGTTNTR